MLKTLIQSTKFVSSHINKQATDDIVIGLIVVFKHVRLQHTLNCCCNFASEKGAKCYDKCLFVRLSNCLHISKTKQNFTKFSAHADCGGGSTLLWRYSDTLYISGFVDDVVFSHSELYMVRHYVLQSDKSVTAETTASTPTEFCAHR